MDAIRMTTSGAMVRYLAAQRIEIDGQTVPLFAGVFAIFGHGNVTCLGHELEQAGEELPTWRGPERAGNGLGRGGLCQGQPPPPHNGCHQLYRSRAPPTW